MFSRFISAFSLVQCAYYKVELFCPTVYVDNFSKYSNQRTKYLVLEHNYGFTIWMQVH